MHEWIFAESMKKIIFFLCVRNNHGYCAAVRQNPYHNSYGRFTPLTCKKKTPLHVYDLWFSTQKRNFYQIVIEVAFSSVYKHCLELSYAWYQLTQSEASRYSKNL